MTLDPANNLAETELTASVSDTATTLPVADASVFPDADSEGAFNVLVWDASANINPSDAPDAEFVRVTSVDTTANELTVERGQEDTSASAKADGSTVTDTWSVKDRDDIDTALNAKADDPHGSESHSSEVVHEGEDATFGDTTHDSVSTERSRTAREPVANVKHYGAAGDDGDDRQAVLDALDQLQNGGTLYFPGSGPNTTYTMDPVYIETDNINVVIESGATVKLKPTTLTESEALNYRGPINILGESDSDRVENVHIYGGGTLDGNKQNITLDGDFDPFDVEATHFEYTLGCSITNMKVVNALADGIDGNFNKRWFVGYNWCESNDKYGIHNSTNVADNDYNTIYGNWLIKNGVDPEYTYDDHQRAGLSIYDGQHIYSHNQAIGNWRSWYISSDDGVQFFANNSIDPVDGVGDLPGNGIKLNGVETGRETHGSLPAASDDSWNNAESDTVSVTFDEPFQEPPRVITDVDEEGTQRSFNIITQVGNVTETGFDLRFLNYVSSPSDNQAAYWIAMS